MFLIKIKGNDWLRPQIVSPQMAFPRQLLPRLLCLTLVSIFQLWATGCSSQNSGTQSLAQANQSEILEAQSLHLRKREITVEAPVVRLLPDDTQGIPHERFLIRLANGSSVLVAHDTNRAPRVPVAVGDVVKIHGEYIWNEKGGVLHWTHHSDSPRHPGGWIELNGQRYE